MLQNLLVKILLSPFSLLYGLIIGIRNVFYDIGFLRSTKFSIPIINIGNLSVGGAGKSPHVDYLINLLKPYVRVATLSRGYNRKTQGYLDVKQTNTTLEVGDEPLMFKRKHPDIPVGVAENRTNGISQVLMDHPETHVILLDDAFQHRAISAGMDILLTNYDRLFTDDYLLPAGRLREWRGAYRRADMIIITKCPDILSEDHREKVLKKINPLKSQMVYFSRYTYYHPYSIYDQSFRPLTSDTNVVLLSAIANTDYLYSYVKKQVNKIKTIDYSDHYNFEERDIIEVMEKYNRMDAEDKIILTTEKDAMRLSRHIEKMKELNMPVYILPVQVEFLDKDQEKFDEFIKQFLLNFRI